MRTKLPEPTPAPGRPKDDEARARDARAKNRMKDYADQKTHVRQLNAQAGDVLIKQRETDKFSINFNPQPQRVVKRQGSTVIIEGARGSRLARNTTHVKRIHAVAICECSASGQA